MGWILTERRFIFSAHPARALLEAWLIGLVILFVLSLQVGAVSPFVLSNGLLFLCGTCGMWVTVRTRLPRGSVWRQGLWELVVGFALSLVMAAGMRLPARFLGWEAVWLQTNLGNSGIATLLLLATGPGYVVARVGVRLWLLWQSLRRQRMLWAITHAHLMLVVLIACLLGLSTFLMLPLSSTDLAPLSSSASPLALLLERLLRTVFPAVAVIVVMTVLALLVLLLPSALFSYLIARRTTRRLETLADAARSLQAGAYDTRVEVVGEDEVAQLQTGFNTMAGELEKAMQDLQWERDKVATLLQSQRELVASVSHELRTPVATVRGYLESSQARWKNEIPEPLQHDLSVMEGEIVRLQGLIDDLLTLSRAEAGGLALELRPTDVGAVIRRRVEAMAPLAWQSNRVEVSAEVPPGLPPALADETRLEQVLVNLLRNGVQHTLPGGIVAVLAAAEEQTLRVEVRDTGEGISVEDLPRIWERFYQGGQAGEGDRAGTGLGLALVKELTEAMGGAVTVQSAPGQGSCFTLRLPLA